MRLKKYNKFINEAVYLFKTMFDSYEFRVNNMSNNAEFIVGIEGQKFTISAQLYGNSSDQEFIFRQPSEISNMEDGDAIFEGMMEDVVYILNKNQLKYKFSLVSVNKERGLSNYHAIVKVDKPTSLSDLERIATTTKIVNSKVKDTGDFDKMIYQTK